MSELEAPDPMLAALYASERAAPLPDGASARVLAGVLASTSAVGAVAATATAAAVAAKAGWSTGAVLGIAVASALVGGTVGALGYRGLAAPPPIVAPAPVVDERRDAPIVQPDAPPEAPPPAPAPTIEPARPRAAPVHDAAVERAPDDAGELGEPLLIDRARAALRRGLVDEALATLMRHERLYPTGALAEERAVLVIEAYVAKGDATLARRRIARYREDYPDGFLRERVDRAATAIP